MPDLVNYLMINRGSYNYNSDSQSISFKNNSLLNKDLIGTSKINEQNLLTAKDFFGFEVTISDDSKKLFDQLKQDKATKIQETLKDIYEKAGMEDEFISERGICTERDNALLALQSKENVDGISPNKIFPSISAYSQDSIADMAVSQAMHLKYVQDYYSEDAILNRISDLGITDSADIDFLLEAQKNIGQVNIEKVEKNIDEITDYAAQHWALSASNGLRGVFDDVISLSGEPVKSIIPVLDSPIKYENLHEDLKENFKSLLNENIGFAQKLMDEGFSGDLSAKVKEFSLNDSTSQFKIGTVDFSAKDLDIVCNFFKDNENFKVASSFDSEDTADSVALKNANLLKDAKETALTMNKDAGDEFLRIINQDVISNEKVRAAYNITFTPFTPMSADDFNKRLNDFYTQYNSAFEKYAMED